MKFAWQTGRQSSNNARHVRKVKLVKGNVETPGDISGVVYTAMDPNGAWKMQLGNNMKDVGIEIDLNKLCR